jgi:hypothetical protein
MWEIWQTFLPLVNLPDIDYTACFFNLLKNGILKALADPTNENHEKHLAQWTKTVTYQEEFADDIAALLKKVAALPESVLADPFAHRDCVDLVRSVITQKLHIDYMAAAIAVGRWQAGQVSSEIVTAMWDRCSKLLSALGDVLDSHEDYSMYKTLLDQGKNRPVNPYFADALKDNLLNDYCRTAAFELVKFVYCKEAAVFENWVQASLASGKLQSTDSFETERTRIFHEFKALPFEKMHEAPACDLRTAIDRILNI